MPIARLASVPVRGRLVRIWRVGVVRGGPWSPGREPRWGARDEAGLGASDRGGGWVGARRPTAAARSELMSSGL